MMKEKKYGILASIDWNSKKWKEYPSEIDLQMSNFDYVKKNSHTYTYLNFAYNEVPGIIDGRYEALIPHFWNELPSEEKSKYVKVVFIKSKSYLDNKTYIVGLYAFPTFRKQQKNINYKGRSEIIDVNISSTINDILLLDKYLDITNMEILNKILPKGKKAGKMSFNYLSANNVKIILDLIRNANPDMIELKSINGIKNRLLQSLPNY